MKPSPIRIVGRFRGAPQVAGRGSRERGRERERGGGRERVRVRIAGPVGVGVSEFVCGSLVAECDMPSLCRWPHSLTLPLTHTQAAHAARWSLTLPLTHTRPAVPPSPDSVNRHG
jgi:hypothetical protein